MTDPRRFTVTAVLPVEDVITLLQLAARAAMRDNITLTTADITADGVEFAVRWHTPPEETTLNLPAPRTHT